MKMLRVAAFLAALLAAGSALAQQTPNHSVPIGRGPGVTGFGSAVPGVSGQPLVSQGVAADPAFGTIANSGFTSGPADTYKGSLNGTNVVDVPRAPCTAASQALRYTAGVGESCGTIVVQTGFDMPVNLGLSVPSPSGGALVITLTQANGSAPSSSSPVLVPFRPATLTSGAVAWATISATQSITIPSGATLGTSNGVPFRLWIFEDYNSGTPELGVATCSNATTIFPCSSWERTLVTTTTMSAGAGAAGTLYSTTGVSLDSVRIIGLCDFASGLTTAGTWASSCTTLQLFGPGIKKPGDVVQVAYAQSTTPATANSTAKVATTTTVSITPTSTVNFIEVTADGSYTNSGGVASQSSNATICRGACTIVSNVCSNYQGTTILLSTPCHLYAFDAPGVVTATSYTVNVWNGVGTNNTIWLNTAGSAGTTSGVIRAQEIQG